MIKILFLFLLLSGPVLAKGEGDENTSATKNEQTAAPDNTPPIASTVQTPDTFVPTETLSQDVSIAFPVDI